MVGQLPGTSCCRAHLVAVFNSGFKMGDITGGYYSHGRTAKPLRNGQAPLVINARGAITIGQWGRDITMNPHTASVRQNLALIVDHGRAANGLTINATNAGAVPPTSCSTPGAPASAPTPPATSSTWPETK